MITTRGPARVLLLLFLLLPALAGAKPQSAVALRLNLLNEAGPGEVAELELELASQISSDALELELGFSEGVLLMSGKPRQTLVVKAGDIHRFRYSVRLPEGESRVTAYAWISVDGRARFSAVSEQTFGRPTPPARTPQGVIYRDSPAGRLREYVLP